MSKSSLIWLKIFFAAYVVFTAFAVLHHEPWRDEAQAWLIVRDVPLEHLFSQANYEGTPFLWHLLLLPLAKWGAPYFSMHLLHLLIAYGTIYLFLFKSNFPMLTRVLFTFSYYMFWEYSVIARSYSLSILILFSIAVVYQQKLKRPILYAALLFLLFNTNMHSIPLTIGLCIAFVYEIVVSKSLGAQRIDDGSTIIAGVIMLAGLMVAIWQLIPAPDNINSSLFQIFNWKRPFIALTNAFFPNVPPVAYITGLVAVIIAGLSGYSIYLKDKVSFFILTIAYTGLGYIFVFKHIGSLRHHGFILTILLFAVWIADYNKKGHVELIEKASQVALSACLGMSVFFAIQLHLNEYNHLFSGAKQVAAYLNTHEASSSAVVVYPSIKGSAIAPYLEESRIWYPDVQFAGSYITWNRTYEKNKDISVSLVLDRGQAAFVREEGSPLFVLDVRLPDALEQHYQLVFQTEGRVFGYGEEVYFVYKSKGRK